MSESFLNGRVRLHGGDCFDVLKTLDDSSIDAVVTDPPYHLTSIVERFGAEDAAPCREGKTGAYARASRGFMGKVWDGGDIAFRPELWAEVFRVLKPGGHLLAFSATRTYHRMAVAIDDAGFEVRDMIQWIYGSGFPKSQNVARFIDEKLGATGSFGEPKSAAHAGWIARGAMRGANGEEGWQRPWMQDAEALSNAARKYVPASPEAQTYDGWGSALKPAQEPICVARKPLVGTIAENVLAHGTGALNIDGCRVAYESASAMDRARVPQPVQHNDARGVYQAGTGVGRNGEIFDPSKGRWPTNVITDGSEEVMAAFPDRSVAAMGPSGGGLGYGGSESTYARQRNESSEGSAARFFYSAKPDCRCLACDALIVVSSSPTENTQTANTAPRDAAGWLLRGSAGTDLLPPSHVSYAELTSFPCPLQNDVSVQSSAPRWPLLKIARNVCNAALLCDSCGTDIARALVEVRRSGKPVPVHFSRSMSYFKERILRQSLASYVEGRESTDIILTTTNLSTLFGCVSHAIAENINSERSEQITASDSRRLFYSAKADANDRLGSSHPTVKPVDLMRYLVRLVTPPGGTVLDPFAGTGTTGEAAWREGFDAVLIEREEEYRVDIARRMEMCLAGPEERARAVIKARFGDLPAGPLFAGLEASE